jgi:hypothetical protein
VVEIRKDSAQLIRRANRLTVTHICPASIPKTKLLNVIHIFPSLCSKQTFLLNNFAYIPSFSYTI